MDAESGMLFLAESLGLSAPVSAPVSSSGLIMDTPDPLQEWAVEAETTLVDSETEELLYGVDPNKVFPSRSTPDSSGSDSGICEETQNQGPDQDRDLNQTTVYQVVYDVSHIDSNQQNVISIELDSWSQLLLSDSCVVNELVPRSGSSVQSLDQMSSELQLTEEEQRLLNQEGVSLPNNLPLTKAEERILKKVRRKIRNKQSAQDSRRRRKEYVDELENRAAACSAQNKELQRTVEQLEKSNMSLLAQLRQLQTLIKRTVSKGAQTSTCLLIIIISLGLIILPSFSPFLRRSAADDYRPIGVISRNILTDSASLQSTVNDDIASGTDLSDVSQSGAEDISVAAAVNQSQPGPEPPPLQGNQSEHSFAPLAGQNSRLKMDKKRDSSKPAHADEM
ncbi:cyclic AMP-responsive element-binding protein 3-like protein 4 isoform X2 [Periophthalmus magnuspinnatus]|uniref:cyclic AMP-responsive element-binding protein 3-like protein 4 isoform X2 n=1 Tax=Periophthalmus magnuspinnatus TaxID=409849 RepID=UPI00145AE28F|nr:cyclic AMP-responsive element-binding protein 3-like protein 4 isoform X2 [Periophthalmus magnuspinnatus]XP_033836888.1 cyclic AMP-responsive element-binding protein 3-like protein 4 isoform X2 [Periophthalmus magnuspinnatus]